MELKEKIKNLPELPGVYRFISSDNEIIYVGKSKSLRSRVRSYFTGKKEGKIERLVHQIRDIEYEVCDTHLEARLLECQRIKELRPVFNKQFKRERGFVYLKIGQSCKEPPLSVIHDPVKGFGPFRNRHLLESVIESFQKLYPMRLLDPIEGAVTARRSPVDFIHYILPQRVSTETYLQNRTVISRLFLEEDLWQDFVGDLETAMMAAAEAEKFQEAIFYRDFAEALRHLKRMWFEDQKLFKELLYLTIPTGQGFKYFRIRNGIIEAKAMASIDRGDEFQLFVQTVPPESQPAWSKFSILEQYDFRDILYSEIRTLPEEQIHRL